jgi:hypothetical protein
VTSSISIPQHKVIQLSIDYAGDGLIATFTN